MKPALCLLALVVVVAARPGVEDGGAEVVRSQFDPSPDGGYNFQFETSNGINRQETGQIKDVPGEDNKPQPVLVVRGSYAYKDVEGNLVSVTYEADENGYKAESDSIPK